MLLVLLLGIADFGRVFTAGITVEAAARNGAEAAAQEYVQLLRNRTDPLSSDDYQRLHRVAAEAVCGEAETLPNQAVTGDCADISEGAASLTMPAVAVCVHDDVDPLCDGSEAAAAPTECAQMKSVTWNPANAGPAASGSALPYVEVHVCYRFTTLLNLTNLELPFGWSLSLGEVWLERGREFVTACYQQAGAQCN